MRALRPMLIAFNIVFLSGCGLQTWMTQTINSAPAPTTPTITPTPRCGSLEFFQSGAPAVPYLLYYSSTSADLTLTVVHGYPNKLIITDITDPHHQFPLQQYPNLPNSPPPSANLLAQGYWQVNAVTPFPSKPEETDLIAIAAPQKGPFFHVYEIQERSVNPKYQSSPLSGPGYFAIDFHSSCVLETPQFGSDQVPTSTYTFVTWQDKCQKLNSPPPGSGSSGGPQAGAISICPTFWMGAQRAGSLPLANGLWLDDDGFVFLPVQASPLPGTKPTDDDQGGRCIGGAGCNVNFSPIGSGWVCGSNQVCQQAMTLTNMAEGDWDFWFVKYDPTKHKLSGWSACGVPLLSAPASTSHAGADNTVNFDLMTGSFGYSIYNPYYIWETNNPNKPNPNTGSAQPEPGFQVGAGLGTFTPKSLPVNDPCPAPPNVISLSEGAWVVSP